MNRRRTTIRWTAISLLLVGISIATAALINGPTATKAAGEPPVWVNSLNYGSAGGGFYWDFTSGQVWTGERGWHAYGPARPPASSTLWVNYLTYGSAGGGFYLDPLSGQVWTSERGWHLFIPSTLGPPTPTPTPTQDPATLVWDVTVTPAAPRVGDTITVTAAARGSGGIPQYTLTISNAARTTVTLDSPSAVSKNTLGDPVTWTLKATGPGTVSLPLSVNYERGVDTPQGRIFSFVSAQGPPVSITVKP